jgi:hypothetical protein
MILTVLEKVENAWIEMDAKSEFKTNIQTVFVLFGPFKPQLA